MSLATVEQSLAFSKSDFAFLRQLPVQIDRDSIREIADYFRQSSILSEILMKDPGSFEMVETIYAGSNGTKGLIDSYIYHSLSGQALRNRLEAVTSFTARQIAESHSIKIANLGSGSGRDTIEALARSPLASSVSVECVDISTEALEMGKQLARERGVAQDIEFTSKSLTQLSYREEMDLGLMIGILCPLSVKRCVAILRKVKPYFRKGGMLVASNVTHKMPEDDPLMAYILREVMEWNLVYKDPTQLREIFEVAGYKWQGAFYDEPTKFHVMGIGIVV